MGTIGMAADWNHRRVSTARNVRPARSTHLPGHPPQTGLGMAAAGIGRPWWGRVANRRTNEADESGLFWKNMPTGTIVIPKQIASSNFRKLVNLPHGAADATAAGVHEQPPLAVAKISFGGAARNLDDLRLIDQGPDPNFGAGIGAT